MNRRTVATVAALTLPAAAVMLGIGWLIVTGMMWGMTSACHVAPFLFGCDMVNPVF